MFLGFLSVYVFFYFEIQDLFFVSTEIPFLIHTRTLLVFVAELLQ